jgi:hypothetical protein
MLSWPLRVWLTDDRCSRPQRAGWARTLVAETSSSLPMLLACAITDVVPLRRRLPSLADARVVASEARAPGLETEATRCAATTAGQHLTCKLASIHLEQRAKVDTFAAIRIRCLQARARQVQSARAGRVLTNVTAWLGSQIARGCTCESGQSDPAAPAGQELW